LSYTDDLENDLTKEYENGRLFRLMVKLGFINERPEFELDPSWSETGDRYLLKLFRDYVFHQVYEDGSPVVDFGHVVECLNKVKLRIHISLFKLDIGSSEKVVLMSRDEQSVLVVWLNFSSPGLTSQL
jgi:PAB-dependent poly(A)-specific ribonuclease subunit 3